MEWPFPLSPQNGGITPLHIDAANKGAKIPRPVAVRPPRLRETGTEWQKRGAAGTMRYLRC